MTTFKILVFISSMVWLILFIINVSADRKISLLYDEYHDGDREKINEQIRKASRIRITTAIILNITAIGAVVAMIIKQF